MLDLNITISKYPYHVDHTGKQYGMIAALNEYTGGLIPGRTLRAYGETIGKILDDQHRNALIPLIPMLAETSPDTDDRVRWVLLHWAIDFLKDHYGFTSSIRPDMNYYDQRGTLCAEIKADRDTRGALCSTAVAVYTIIGYPTCSAINYLLTEAARAGKQNELVDLYEQMASAGVGK